MLQRGRWIPVLGRHVVARARVQSRGRFAPEILPVPARVREGAARSLHTVTNRYGKAARPWNMSTGWGGVSLSDVPERDSRAVKSSTHITYRPTIRRGRNQGIYKA